MSKWVLSARYCRSPRTRQKREDIGLGKSGVVASCAVLPFGEKELVLGFNQSCSVWQGLFEMYGHDICGWSRRGGR